MLAGLGFGLAFGLTQRLLSLNVGELVRFGQGFDVQAFPGTSLESLRLRFGEAAAELRGDLELEQLERQQQQEAKQRADDARQAEEALNQMQREDEPAAPAPELPPEPAAAAPTAPPPAPALPQPAEQP